MPGPCKDRVIDELCANSITSTVSGWQLDPSAVAKKTSSPAVLGYEVKDSCRGWTSSRPDEAYTKRNKPDCFEIEKVTEKEFQRLLFEKCLMNVTKWIRFVPLTNMRPYAKRGRKSGIRWG